MVEPVLTGIEISALRVKAEEAKYNGIPYNL
jgi:hypothetical protein